VSYKLDDEEASVPMLAGMVDGEASEGDATVDVVEDVSVVVLFVIDGVICTGVEVEETNGGAFSMYELSGCTA